MAPEPRHGCQRNWARTLALQRGGHKYIRKASRSNVVARFCLTTAGIDDILAPDDGTTVVALCHSCLNATLCACCCCGPVLGRSTLMSSHVNGHLERGISLKTEGRYEEAVTVLRELLNNDPNSSDGHHQLGLVYGFTGMFDESLEELQHAVTLAPTRMDLRNDLALTYSMLGRYDEAKIEFEEVLRRDPSNKRALDSLKFFSEPV